MSGTASSEVHWHPPKRPDWVEKVNAAGRGLDICSIVPLKADELISTAMKNTGLSDFGVNDWRDPFHILVKGLEQDADLNLLGRIMTRSDLLRTLEARLRIEDTYRQHPEIEDQVIEAPLLITGAARTGTSALLNVLAADPDNQAPLCWETWIPVPPPEDLTYDTDPRIERADKMALMWSEITPEWAGIHEVRGHIPVEDNFLHEFSFRSRVMIWHGKNPGYLYWSATADLKPANDYMLRVLKLLQWKHKRKRWIIKTPALAVPLELLFETFPDAQMVYTHRDPVVSIQSGINIVNMTYWIRSDNYQSHRALCAAVTSEDAIAAATDRNIDLIEKNVVPSKRIFHIQYNDFIKDNLKSVEQIYGHFDIELSEKSRQAIKNYVEENAKERKAKGTHKYAQASPEKITKVRRLFKRYQEYFNVPNEV